jgi:hypothetical protein
MKVSRSIAEHHPSSKRNIVSAPHLSIEIWTSGTPVSLIIMTSSRQQQAWQFEQAILVSDIFSILMVMYIINKNIYAFPSDWSYSKFVWVVFSMLTFEP